MQLGRRLTKGEKLGHLSNVFSMPSRMKNMMKMNQKQKHPHLNSLLFYQ